MLRGDGFCCGGRNYDAVILPDTGTYYVRIDPPGTNTGTYTVQLHVFAGQGSANSTTFTKLDFGRLSMWREVVG